MATKKKKISFEEGLERLENIASQMERGELPLDELMKMYEEGIKLSGELNQKLELACNRMMEVRLDQNGESKVTDTDIVQQENLLNGLLEE